jgi:hypothetical protein
VFFSSANKVGLDGLILSGGFEVKLDGSDVFNLLHQTRCTTYDQLQYNSKDKSFFSSIFFTLCFLAISFSFDPLPPWKR